MVSPVFWPGVAMLIFGQGWLSGRGVPMQCLLAGCGRVNNWPGVARVGSGCLVDSCQLDQQAVDWPGVAQTGHGG